MPSGIQQAPLLNLATDALIFINGKDRVFVDENLPEDQSANLGRALANDIQNVNVHGTTDGDANTADFSLNVPWHSQRQYIKKGEIAFKAMQEVEVYIRGRFLVKNSSNNSVKNLFIPPSPQYYQVFWGVITAVKESYSNGQHKINVNCKGMEYWLNTRLNASAAMSILPLDIENDKRATTSSFPPMTVHDIIFNEFVQKLIDLARPTGLKDNEDVDAAPADTGNNEPRNKEAKRFLQVSRRLRMFGLSQVGETVSIYNTTTRQDVVTSDYDLKEKQKGDARTLGTDGDRDINFKVLLSPDTVATMCPVTLSFSLTRFKDNYKTNSWEHVKNVAKLIGWEIFMDMDGMFIYKPPFYNLDVRKSPIHVIDDIDIISWDFSEKAPTITHYTSTGAPSTDNEATNVGIWEDQRLTAIYGRMTFQESVDFINAPDALMLYSQASLDTLNKDRLTLSMSIIGRPELRLGYPVYISSRDEFWYITSIDHSFTFKDKFTTNLTLKAGRKRRFVRKSEESGQDLLFQGGQIEVNKDGNYEIAKNMAYVLDLGGNNKFQSLVNTADIDQLTKKAVTVTAEVFKKIRGESKEGKELLKDLTKAVPGASEIDDKDPPPKDVNFYSSFPGIWVLQLLTDSEVEVYNKAVQRGFESARDKIEHPINDGKSIAMSYGQGDQVLRNTDRNILRGVQLITDKEGYDIYGNFAYGKDLELNENGFLEVRVTAKETSVFAPIKVISDKGQLKAALSASLLPEDKFNRKELNAGNSRWSLSDINKTMLARSGSSDSDDEDLVNKMSSQMSAKMRDKGSQSSRR